MGALFGKHKKNKSRVTDVDKAIFQLKQQRDQLKVYQKRIQSSLDQDIELVRKLVREGKKDRARLLLRKKKYQEQLLTTTDGQLENLEKLTSDIEFSLIEAQVVDRLRDGNEALKRVNAMLNINEIERILDETREGVDKQKEIDEMLGGALSEQDEEDVMAELDSIMEEQKSVHPAIQPPTDIEAGKESDDVEDLPEVPTDEPEVERKRAKTSKPKEQVAVEAS